MLSQPVLTMPGSSAAAPLSDDGPLKWYALRIRSRVAPVTHEVLCSKGYEAYFPIITNRRRRSDRTVTIDTPLFPGYLFCRFDLARRSDVVSTPGLIGIAGYGSAPAAIAREEIESVRRVMNSDLDAERWPYLSVGMPVYIGRGPLTGLYGILTAAENVNRLVVSVTILQRSVAVRIERNWISPAPENSIQTSLAVA